MCHDHDPFAHKASLGEIRARFESDVDRFSSLETGQAAAMDSVLGRELVVQAAWATTPDARRLLDLGCGAGNYALAWAAEGERLGAARGELGVTLVDLSGAMLRRAGQRLAGAGVTRTRTLENDLLSLDLPESSQDTILAAMVLHHLRADEHWRAMFQAIARWLAPGGGVWIHDMVEADDPSLAPLQRRQYVTHLEGTLGADRVDDVLAYIESEDSPRPLLQQVDWLREAGLAPRVLHKHGPFAAFGAVKPRAGG